VPQAGGRSFSWIDPVPLWQSRNQTLARLLGDPTNDERRLWMRLQREAGKLQEDLVIDEGAGREEVSFIVIGDTGEGDASQQAVVDPLLARGLDTDFMIFCSDVIYPAGDAEDYDAKFYAPYEVYQKPIYALPGNHDWYDGLVGFMHHLCGADVSALPAVEERPSSLKERLRRLLWRRPAEKTSQELPARRRGEEGRRTGQRSPYFAIDAGPLLLVGIDTGMGGPIDREQAAWLRETRARTGPRSSSPASPSTWTASAARTRWRTAARSTRWSSTPTTTTSRPSAGTSTPTSATRSTWPAGTRRSNTSSAGAAAPT
jgi:hypothetical protein